MIWLSFYRSEVLVPKAFVITLLVLACLIAAAWWFLGQGSTATSHGVMHPVAVHATADGEAPVAASPDERQAVQRTPASTPSSAVAADAILAVRVYRAPDLPVAGVRVHADGEVIATTDARGAAEVAVSPGRRLLTLDPASLPDGLMAPIRQSDIPPEHAVPDGFYAQRVQCEAGKRAEVAIRVFAPAVVVGVVVDAVGVPVAGCSIRLQSEVTGLVGIAFDAETDSSGLFTFAGIPPSSYSVKAYATHAKPRAVSPSPLPVRLRVQEGVRHNLAPFVSGDQSARLVARVVDQDGKPVVGVQVQVYPQDLDCPPGERPIGLGGVILQVMTDAEGAFDVGVPSAHLAVQVHGDGALLPWSDPLRLRRIIQPTLVSAHLGTNDLGVIRGEFSRPYRLTVRIKNNVERIRGLDPTLRSIRDPDVHIVAPEAIQDRSRWQRLAVDDGVAEFCCDTPADPLVLIVSRAHFAALRRTLTPTATREDLDIEYP
jgi:hypothetical protein